jgi:hypothetical protein
VVPAGCRGYQPKDVEPGGKLPKKDIALLSSFLTGALTDE